MGNNAFYDEPGNTPTFTLSDLANFKGSISEVMPNLTGAQLQPTPGGAPVTTAIDNAIALSPLDPHSAGGLRLASSPH
jgi:hypothetical protein